MPKQKQNKKIKEKNTILPTDKQTILRIIC